MDREALFQYARDHHGVEPEYLWAKFPTTAVLRHAHNRKWYAAVMDVAAEKIGGTRGEIVPIVDVKLAPALVASLSTQPGYAPGYHMNKEHWLTIRLDGSVPDEEIRTLLDMSYEMTKNLK